MAAALQWDGRFAAVGRGVTAAGLTCDHVNLEADGRPGSRGLYTAASKESLHIGMLALVVSRTRLAHHWMAGALAEEAGLADVIVDQDAAVAAAVERLVRIADAYEGMTARHYRCPSRSDGQR